MAQQHINLGTPPAGSDGDTVRIAFTKAESNFNELYPIATSAQSVANAAVALDGSKTITGGLTFQGSGNAVRRGVLLHNANSQVDYGYKMALTWSGSTTELGYVALVPTGANGYATELQVTLKSADYYNAPTVLALQVTPTAFKYNGNTVWHAGNTTVDANNFIKKV